MSIIESVQQYDLNIPVGGAQSIDVEGDMVRFLSAVDPFAKIEIRPNFAQGNITLKPGQGFKFSERVKRWVVLNKGTVPLSGYLMIGSGDFFDQRISGTVDVIDGGKARTLSNQAFGGFAYQANVAAQYTRLQLWNPAGSGKNIVLENVLGLATTTGAAVGHIRLINSPLATLSSSGVSKMAGGAASAMQLRTDTTATVSPNSAALAGQSICGGHHGRIQRAGRRAGWAHAATGGGLWPGDVRSAFRWFGLDSRNGRRRCACRANPDKRRAGDGG